MKDETMTIKDAVKQNLFIPCKITKSDHLVLLNTYTFLLLNAFFF